MQEIADTNPNPSPNPCINGEKTPKMTPYEQSRQQRIKANLEKMRKLGLADLSLKLNSFTSPKRAPKLNSSSHKPISTPQPSGPLRRSSRLHNATPVSYSETALSKRDGLLEDMDLRLENGSKPEVYTEEHEKLLGDTKRSWTLFVDGCGKDGKRIYDQVKGKTCHQCRQKTLGHRTHCSKCQMVQGQFCGDCLYMRYGEHVIEANKNPNWICPVCRGICNCSLCRQAKGWAPTGALYRKIKSLGYKSVAHYLIQTQRSQKHVKDNSVTAKQASVKRSLPFSDMETQSGSSSQINGDQKGLLVPESKDMVHEDNELKTMHEKQMLNNVIPAPKRSLPFSGSDVQPENAESVADNANREVHNHGRFSEPMLDDKKESELEIQEVKELPENGKFATNCLMTRSILICGGEAEHDLLDPEFEDRKECKLKCEKDDQLLNNGNLADGQPMRSMHVSGCESDILEPTIADWNKSKLKNEEVPKLLSSGDLATGDLTEKSVAILGSETESGVAETVEVNREIYDCGSEIPEDKRASEKFKSEEKQVQTLDKEQDNRKIVVETCQIHKRKHVLAFQPSPDSIASRLRQRRQKVHGYVDAELTDTNEKISNIEPSQKCDSSNQKVEKEKELHADGNEHAYSTPVTERKLKKKPARSAELNPDSIGGRLRDRRRMSRTGI